jgi:hypothetical protein
MRDVPLHLAADGLTIVQPHIQATTKFAKQQGYIVARVEPAYREFAQSIVDAFNARLPPQVTGRSLKPEELR